VAESSLLWHDGQETGLLASKLTFLSTDDQASRPEAAEYLLHILLMLLQGLAGHNNVIKVDEDEGKSGKNTVHHTLEGTVLPAFLRPTRRRRNLKKPKRVMMAVLGMTSRCI
jgi:hypothetical protein